jgi:hypothetical protein
MDYRKHYDLLMEKANNRELLKDTYTERHHILPRCLGGGNNKNNIVNLLPKEHYFAHLLLFRLYPNNQKLSFAFWMMCNGNRKKNRKYVVSSKIYEEVRTKFIELVKQREPSFKGKKHTEESKLKNRLAHLGKKTWIGKSHSEESKKKMSISAKGRKLSDDTKKKMSNSKKGIKLSDDTKKKMSESSKGENNNYTKYLKRMGLPHIRSKPIEQYTKDGILIKEWVNAHAASLSLGLSYTAINSCLNGKAKTSQGYIWKFK